jgi:hypothetical protein
MTISLKNTWNTLNKYLSIINGFIWGLTMWDAYAIQKAKTRKIPLVLNVLLFFVLLFLAFVMTYGAYRTQAG